jgi:hypothetical protein
MSLDLADFERKLPRAIRGFWKARRDSGVRSGKTLTGMFVLIEDVVRLNGMPDAVILSNQSAPTLPGYFRPTKRWDMVIKNGNRLIAAIELKSHVGSLGNNFNNRAEEAIGSGHDLAVAYREGAFGEQRAPFVGWIMLLEDSPKANTPVKDAAPSFPVFPEFRNTSYSVRYRVLCEKLMQERLYTAAALLLSPPRAIVSGASKSLNELTSIKAFIAQLAGHIATEAAANQ